MAVFKENCLYLIYDGACILCKSSAEVVQIKKSVGEFELINARDHGPLVKKVLEDGYDLNEGIVVHYNGRYFYGSDAWHFLAWVGKSLGFRTRLNKFLFRYRWTAYCIYPLLKSMRNFLLWIRRIPKLQ